MHESYDMISLLLCITTYITISSIRIMYVVIQINNYLFIASKKQVSVNSHKLYPNLIYLRNLGYQISLAFVYVLGYVAASFSPA